ncbi:MAG: cell division protein ZapA [Paenibacillaceae bacterium]|jgi:cell division protein ZapA (FtsZ GTPase activity inhibitor)|nr:cell division protein ZapA [Paenibacillaceae bacterium]
MAPEQKHRVTIDIYGKSYKIVGSLSQAALHALSQWINDKLNMTARMSPKLDVERVYVLTLLHIAEEYAKLRSKAETAEAERQHMQTVCADVRDVLQRAEDKVRVQEKEIQLLLERTNWLEEQLAQHASRHNAPHAHVVLTEDIALDANAAHIVMKQQTLLPIVDDVGTHAQAELLERPDEETLAHKYAQLQAEYAKMKQDFDDWIALLEDNKTAQPKHA